MNKAIFYQSWGGLGDNLQFSTLPELYYNIGIPFYVNKDNVCRNVEINKLVWETNPYFKGYTDETPNCGSILPYFNVTGNQIMNWESIHGFLPKNKIPKLYYKPNIIDKLKDKIVLSLQFISGNYQYFTEEYLYNNIFDYIENRNSDLILLKYNNVISVNKKEINFNYSSIDFFDINNIFDLCDVINSCEHFITLQSGGAVLASALNKKTTVFVDKSFLRLFKFTDQPDKYIGDYLFENIKYIGI